MINRYLIIMKILIQCMHLKYTCNKVDLWITKSYKLSLPLEGIYSPTWDAPCDGRTSWAAEKQEEILREDQLGEHTE